VEATYLYVHRPHVRPDKKHLFFLSAQQSIYVFFSKQLAIQFTVIALCEEDEEEDNKK